MAIKINICGDLVPTKLNEKFFINGDVNALIGDELTKLFLESDLNIVNLECPLTDNDMAILKNGPCLKASPLSINGIKQMNIHVCSLANNHILDYDEQGLIDTVNVLKDNSLKYVGVSPNTKSINKYLIIEKQGIKIGLYSCAEHEFSIVQDNSWGANPLDLCNISNDISDLKKQCDYLIVLLHGGKELYQYPTPNMQKVCRYIATSGADLVITQHSHCIGAEEDFAHKKIIYGQGNFLFASENDNALLSNSIVIQIELSNASKPTIKYIPIVRKEYGCRIADEKRTKDILNEFYKRSIIVKDDKKLKDKYDEFCLTNIYGYLISLSGIANKNYFFRFLNKITKQRYSKIYIKHKYCKKTLLAILNCFECEPHNELIINGLRLLINSKE